MRKAPLAILLVALVAGVIPAPPAGAAGLGTLIAPTSACPGQAGPSAPVALQERSMLCLVNFARRGRGLGEMTVAPTLARAADRKSADILRCDSFSHEACGRPFTYWMRRFGYLRRCASVAENIAWGSGEQGGARSIFRAWMRSSGHRENILGPYEEIGVGLRLGDLEGRSEVRVWTQDFGGKC
jgi:uncharacterized protein YkwD